MDYQQTLQYIYSRMPLFQMVGKSAYKEGLDGITSLCAAIGNPQDSLRCIHIAGTNGKGSVSHTTASILQEAGYKVGLFTSPHLKDFRERIRINGDCVPEDWVVRFVETNAPIFDQIYPSFFEVCTAMAFQYFAEQQVDYAVIECGLGGRLDSTNIITPVMSCITNISIDHTDILGDTIEKIAIEKAGIMKYKVPMIVGNVSDDIFSLYRTIGGAHKSMTILRAQDYCHCNPVETTSDYQSFLIINPRTGWEYKPYIVRTPLLGLYQRENINCAVAMAELMIDRGEKISEDAIIRGVENVLKNTHLQGRWQTLSDNPRVICDCGHNEAGIQAVADQLSITPYNRLHFVFGMMRDKDASHILPILPKDAIYYFAQAANKRAMPSSDLTDLATTYGLHGSPFPTVASALSAAKEAAAEGDLVFVGGSCYVVAEVV